MVFGHMSTSASINIADLKTSLQERKKVTLLVKSYEEIDFKTKKEKQRDIKRSSEMSKKFGPLRMGLRLRNIRRSNVNFQLDLLETYKIMNETRSFQDLYTAFQPDPNYTFLGSELRSEIKGVIAKITSVTNY